MRTTYEAWVEKQRPIYSRLPGLNGAYQAEGDNTPADWITRWFDAFLIDCKALIDDLPRNLNAATCDPEWLDFLGALSGFVGEYWQKAWPEAVKRQLIQDAFSEVWPNKGSAQTLSYLLTLLSINHEIWQGSAFYADVTVLPGLLGEPEYYYFIRLPLNYLRNSPQFRQAEQFNRLYGPAFCDSRVCYDRWYAGFSACGDPVFDA